MQRLDLVLHAGEVAVDEGAVDEFPDLRAPSSKGVPGRRKTVAPLQPMPEPFK
jgi:hypothetical protein